MATTPTRNIPMDPHLRDGLAALRHTRPRLARLMGYYRNPIADLAAFLPCAPTASLSVRPYRQFQELGLPTRITGFRVTADGDVVPAGPVESQRKEVVIENDIAWRLHTLVDFVCGTMPVITSTARHAATRMRLTNALNAVLDASGGVALLQQLVLTGAIHGAAYLMLQAGTPITNRLAATAGGMGGGNLGEGENPAGAREAGSDIPSTEAALRASPETHTLRLVTLDASRVLPVFPPDAVVASGAPLRAAAVAAGNCRDAPPAAPATRGGFLLRARAWLRGVGLPAKDDPADEPVDLYQPATWQRFRGDTLVSQTPNPLGFVPLVGYVNQPDPAGGGVPGLGLSDVEPLLPLQDELNTRLSDRACRVTLQSFRMYLGKGIEDFLARPIAPGQMWTTDNPDATVESFGGDTATPSEDAHINEIREAMDKISGVTPVAAGLLRGKLGNLTSAVALRVTLIALLARTERKRASLALTLQAACRRVLEVLHAAGIEPSDPEDRGIEINWPSALPENLGEKLAEAQQKVALGVRRAVVLAELGYAGDELVADAEALSPGAPAEKPHDKGANHAESVPGIGPAPGGSHGSGGSGQGPGPAGGAGQPERPSDGRLPAGPPDQAGDLTAAA